MTIGDLKKLRDAVAKMAPGPWGEPELDVPHDELAWWIDSPHPDVGVYVTTGATAQDDARVAEAKSTAQAVALLCNHAEALIALAGSYLQDTFVVVGERFCNGTGHYDVPGLDPSGTLCDCDPAEVDEREI